MNRVLSKISTHIPFTNISFTFAKGNFLKWPVPKEESNDRGCYSKGHFVRQA